MSNLKKIPTLQDLVENDEQSIKDNALAVILNQPPPEKWIINHPIISGYRYLPIERVEYLLTRIFNKWWVEVKDVQVIANSVAVTVRVVDYQEGAGAAPLQTDKGAGAMDWNYAKSTGVQMALPMAKTYAVKDAVEQFGKLFGKDISRKNQIDYDSILKPAKVDPLDERVIIMLDNCNSESEVILLEEDLKNQGQYLLLSSDIVDKITKKKKDLN